MWRRFVLRRHRSLLALAATFVVVVEESWLTGLGLSEMRETIKASR